MKTMMKKNMMMLVMTTTMCLLALQTQPAVAGGDYYHDDFWDDFYHHHHHDDHRDDYNSNNVNFNNGLYEQRCLLRMRDCVAKNNLATRLAARRVGTSTTVLSTIQDMINNFDLNRDNCITSTEYIAVVTSRGFSVEYARNQFTSRLLSGKGVNNAVCPGGLSVLTLNALPKPLVVNEASIINNNLQELRIFCDQDTSRYLTNCDCIQIPTTCNTAPFQQTPACINFRSSYSHENNCPFSTAKIVASQALCASGRFDSTTSPQLIPLIRVLCRYLNQKANSVG